MPFKIVGAIWRCYPLRIGILALVWVIGITSMHQGLNGYRENRQVVTMGYMPVITNLAAPLLDFASSAKGDSICLRAIKFASFAEMAEALRNDEIQAAFMIAPLSIVLKQQGEDVKVVYIGNRHESTMVVRKDLKASSLRDLEGCTIAVPMRYSGHNLAIRRLLEEAGLAGRIRIVEMNPPDMASALSAGSLDAYFVGEPFAAQTLKEGASKLFFHVENVWPGFICNLLVVKKKMIDHDPQSVRVLVEGAVRSSLWAQQNLQQAAEIASRYWGQPLELVQYAMNGHNRRIVFDRFVPLHDEMQQIADLMVRFKLVENPSIEGLIDSSFGKQARTAGISADIKSLFP